jgi:stress response protein SCP2
MNLQSGQNISIASDLLMLTVKVEPEDGPIEVDFCAFMLTASGKVLADDGMIFYGQPTSVENSVLLDINGFSIKINLRTVPANITRIAISLSIHEGLERAQVFGDLRRLELSSTVLYFEPDLTGMQQTALILGEVYLRNEQWKFRAVGQGFSGGLATLARSFGVDITQNPAMVSLPVDIVPIDTCLLFDQAIPDLSMSLAATLHSRQEPRRASFRVAQSWVPPFGAPSMTGISSRSIFGMRQTESPIDLTLRNKRRPDSDPDLTRPLPPPGNYEFFSILAGAWAPDLLALDPSKGALYAWHEGSQHWRALEHETGGLLAETTILRSDWRCELSCDDTISRILLPTTDGLACLIPDGVSLRYGVTYIGRAPAIGAPIKLSDYVWAPLQLANGKIRFVSIDVQGRAGQTVDLDCVGVRIGRVHMPFSDGRIALWPCVGGQLLLRKQTDGGLEAKFQPWPINIEPTFEFGSPYLSRDGGIWQLCFDEARDGYIYIKLGMEDVNIVSTMTPRPCSGIINYRFSTKYQNEPWVEPEHGDDGAVDTVILPVLESISSESVIGIKLSTTSGMMSILKSTDRMRAILVLDDATAVTEFHTFFVAEPWRLRLFVHDGLLWAGHPLLTHLAAWKIPP